ncbi:DUF6473 family protein [uncultured Tateyamaria sp.]|uniref:DUF6473 family protein n=1 Tax=uncultured Tateyamaria sp. TaxID=455651 RepID=UPI002636ADB4|nr:DUF6473 family protein [uncultured Tateyamaria sp.]
MSFEALSPGGLDYLPCRYGNSKVLFRGPRRSLNKPFVAFLGGTTTYGKFIPTPFPDIVEAQTGLTCVNFGSLNGGLDVIASDPVLREMSVQARVTVIQITSPRNMSNRFYRVHPRRNDRFVEASALLRAIYRDVDFAEFNFTNHMLQRLCLVSPDRFQAVLDELRAAWIARMRLVLSQITGKTILLWASEHTPEEIGTDIDADPAFVTRDMLDAVIPLATKYAEVVAAPRDVEARTEGMVFSELEAPAAKMMLGPQMHRDIADMLVPLLKSIT